MNVIILIAILVVSNTIAGAQERWEFATEFALMGMGNDVGFMTDPAMTSAPLRSVVLLEDSTAQVSLIGHAEPILVTFDWVYTRSISEVYTNFISQLTLNLPGWPSGIRIFLRPLQWHADSPVTSYTFRYLVGFHNLETDGPPPREIAGAVTAYFGMWTYVPYLPNREYRVFSGIMYRAPN